MITLTTAPAAVLDAARLALPSAATDAADAAPGTEGKPVPFAMLLGIALDGGAPGDASTKTPAAEPKADKDASEGPAAAVATDAAALLIAGGAIPVPVATPAATGTPAASDATTAQDVAHAQSATARSDAMPPGAPTPSAATVASAANDSPAAKDARPPSDAPAPPASHAEPAAKRESPTQAAMLASPAVAAMPDAVKAPDAPSSPAIAPASHAGPVAEAPAFHGRVSAPVHAPEFPREFASQVRIAVQQGVEQASIAVNPPELGPVEVRLEISNGEARVHFAAESAATREVLTDAISKLREMLGSQGLTLSGSTVGAELPQREQAGAPRQGNTSPSQAGAQPAQDADPAPSGRGNMLRLVDVFA